ncbi:hypothetical protein SUDANB176_05700 [Streptomyces sp. enrichment culture]|uniref:CHAT domain-containing protein n=1 Tax=Streptomyces sp. enrichment culture TaxID=1795815 RepID=UPI003F546BE3
MGLDAVLDRIQSSVDDQAAMAHWAELAVRRRDVRDDRLLWPAVNLTLGRGLRVSAAGDAAASRRARRALEDACEGFERTRDEDSLAMALHELGLLLGDGRFPGDPVRNLEDSIACHRRCLELRAGAEDGAMAAYELGRRYRRRTTGSREQNIETAIDCLKDAARRYGALRHRTRQADALDLLSRCYEERVRGSRRDNLESAIESCAAALELCDERSGWRNWLPGTVRLGRLYDRRIAGDRAENCERALEIFQRALRSVDPRTNPEGWSEVQHALGVAYSHRERGDRTENIELALRHLTESLRHLDPTRAPMNWSLTHHALAAAYDYRVAGDRGANLDRAVEHLEAALRTCDRDEDPGTWAMINQSMALVRARRSHEGGGSWREDHDRARQALEDVLTVRTRETDPQGYARAMETLAYLTAGRWEPGPPARGEGPGPGASARSDADGRLAEADRTLADLRAAAGALDRGTDPEGWARNRVVLEDALARRMSAAPAADAAERDRLWEERIALLEEALEIYTPDSRPSLSVGIAERLGTARAALGRWAEAADAFGTAIDAAESLRPTALTVLSRRRHGESTGSLPRLGSYCLARAGRLTEAVVMLEQGRARALGDTLDRDHRRLEALRRDHPRLYRFYGDAVERLRRIQDTEDPSGDAGEFLTDLARRSRAAQDALGGIVRRIRGIPGYEDFLRTPGPDVLAAAVRPDAPLAYLNTTPWGTLTLLVTGADSPAVQALWADDVTAEDLNDLLHRSASPDSVFPLMAGYLRLPYDIVETRFPDGNASLTFGSLWSDPDAVERVGREELSRLDVLGPAVVRPLARALGESGATRVALVPTGMLSILPLHTLAYDGERCLIDDVGVTFAPSARVLSRARERAEGDWPEATLAGVANPLPHDTPLRFAGRELEKAAENFSRSTRLHGQDATKEKLLGAAASATHVHLACHGAVPFSGDEQPYVELADGERLTLEEISRLRPFGAARMVVLSACQSALVGSMRAPDETPGLPTAVMLSGTPGVIGTLWPVNDLSTALLMERFYALHLRGDSTSRGPLPPWQALGRAQRWLSTLTAAELRDLMAESPALRHLAQENENRSPGARSAMAALRLPPQEAPDDLPFADPLHWAPFVYIGE